MLTPEAVVKQLDLISLEGEGGMFRRNYFADESYLQAHLPTRYVSDKPYGSAIYYMLTDANNSFSEMHRLPSDEVFHFYLGDAVEMLNLYPDGSGEKVILGQDILNGELVQHVVPRGVWQGCRLVTGGKWALMGTTMAPAYTPEDYEQGERDKLITTYPDFAELIQALTR